MNVTQKAHKYIAEFKKFSKKTHISVGVVGIALLIIVSILYASSEKKITTTVPKATSSTLSFNNNVYTKAFTIPANATVDHTSESHEWITGTDTLENWKTLITTHKLSPLSGGVPLDARIYAENVLDANKKRGAVMIETSVINAPDAVAKGIDVRNPPYLLVYVFPKTSANAPIEFNLQKIINTKEKGIDVFIFSERLTFTTDKELNDYLNSQEYDALRLKVIQAEM